MFRAERDTLPCKQVDLHVLLDLKNCMICNFMNMLCDV